MKTKTILSILLIFAIAGCQPAVIENTSEIVEDVDKSTALSEDDFMRLMHMNGAIITTREYWDIFSFQTKPSGRNLLATNEEMNYAVYMYTFPSPYDAFREFISAKAAIIEAGKESGASEAEFKQRYPSFVIRKEIKGEFKEYSVLSDDILARAILHDSVVIVYIGYNARMVGTSRDVFELLGY